MALLLASRYNEGKVFDLDASKGKVLELVRL